MNNGSPMPNEHSERNLGANEQWRASEQTKRVDETESGVTLPVGQDALTTVPRQSRRANSDQTFPTVPGYEIVELLGSGAFGKVFRAVELPGQLPCAIKQIGQPGNIEAERKSLEAIRELRHDAIIDIRAFFIHDGRLNIVMPVAEETLGRRLANEFSKSDGIPANALLDYFRDIAGAIDFLHDNGRVHRDIKPENIVFVDDKIKVADFGTLEQLTASRGTVDAEAFGTPGFMAPEVWDNLASARSDQYSLAVMYATLRMGRPPFQGRTVVDYCDAHRHVDPELSKITCPSERAVIQKALAKMRTET